MPRIEPKAIQKDLESGQIRALYWLFGAEELKARELVKRIHTALSAPKGKKTKASADAAMGSMEKLTIDASEVSLPDFVDSLRSPSLGARFQLYVVRGAHAWKDLEPLVQWAKEEEAGGAERPVGSVAVLFAKDLDVKKKTHKLVAEDFPCVPCEEVAERDRLAWIRYLAERRELKLPSAVEGALLYHEPWNLDRIEQDLERLSLTPPEYWKESFGESESPLSTPAFIDAFFRRSRTRVMAILPSWAKSAEDYFPLLGLISWYARQMDSALKGGAAVARERWRDFLPNWDERDLGELTFALQELDLKLKSAPIDATAAWTMLALKFCKGV